MRSGQQNKRGRGRNNNNNRKPSNPLSRSYDSAGPDVKVRGTAQHIAEKYMALARDAQSSGDRVVAENYLQHAEHYNRIISIGQAQLQERQQRDEAQREERANLAENGPVQNGVENSGLDNGDMAGEHAVETADVANDDQAKLDGQAQSDTKADGEDERPQKRGQNRRRNNTRQRRPRQSSKDVALDDAVAQDSVPQDVPAESKVTEPLPEVATASVDAKDVQETTPPAAE